MDGRPIGPQPRLCTQGRAARRAVWRGQRGDDDDRPRTASTKSEREPHRDLRDVFAVSSSAHAQRASTSRRSRENRAGVAPDQCIGHGSGSASAAQPGHCRLAVRSLARSAARVATAAGRRWIPVNVLHGGTEAADGQSTRRLRAVVSVPRASGRVAQDIRWRKKWDRASTTPARFYRWSRGRVNTCETASIARRRRRAISLRSSGQPARGPDTIDHLPRHGATR